jgi:hypothetical protein
MVIAGILGSWELLVTIGGILLIAGPVIFRKLRGTQDYTEKLDQLERLERMYRDGSITEREFKRQKRKIMKKK